MNPTVKLTRKQAAQIIDATFPEYEGRKISIEFTDSVTMYDLHWDGGTKNDYTAIGANGKTLELNDNFVAPWDDPREGAKVPVTPAYMVVEHSWFCGHDLGIRIYAHPSYLPNWLPEGGSK